MKLRSADSGILLRNYSEHLGRVTSVKFFPDGRRAVSGSGDGTLKIWDLESGGSDA